VRTRRAPCALLLLVLLASGDALAGPPRPAARPMGPVANFLVGLASSLAENALDRLVDRSGLFDAIGPDAADSAVPDPLTRRDLDEITSRLGGLDQAIASLTDDVERLESLLLTLPARQTIAGAQVRFRTCYDRLADLAAARVQDPELVAQHNRALLARAYQAAGLPPPAALGLSDDDCALLEPLNQVQAALLPEAPGSSRPLLDIARLARQKAEPFENVVAYFTWSVAIQRRAMAIMAQAHHRLGEDALLAERTAALERSLRRQEIELLHAAEAYVAYQPTTAPFSGEALELADLVVARLQGVPHLVSASLLFLPRSFAEPAAPTLRRGDAEVPLGDQLAALGETYYGRQRASAVAPEGAGYFYVIPRTRLGGVEVGRSDELSLARYRTADVPLDQDTVTLTVRGRARALPLVRRNAATLAEETALQDRLLLSHADGAATQVARFSLRPEPGDPRRVRLTVDLPARGLSGVPVGPVDAGASRFAARPGLEASVLELVPFGPAEPDRYALGLGGRWLGVVPAAPAGGEPEPAAPLVLVDAPFWFELERDGAAVRLAHLAPDGGRRHLYVNEQSASATAFEVANAPGGVDLLAGAMAPQFDVGTPPSMCPALAIDVHTTDQPVGYQLSMWFDPATGFSPCLPTGTCTLDPPAQGMPNATLTFVTTQQVQIGPGLFMTTWQWFHGSTMSRTVAPAAGQVTRLSCQASIGPGCQASCPGFGGLAIGP
jgi:hypothetical protein